MDTVWSSHIVGEKCAGMREKEKLQRHFSHYSFCFTPLAPSLASSLSHISDQRETKKKKSTTRFWRICSTSYRVGLQPTIVEDRAAGAGGRLRGSSRPRSFCRLRTRTVRAPRGPAESWQTSLHLRVFLAGFIYDLSRKHRHDLPDPHARFHLRSFARPSVERTRLELWIFPSDSHNHSHCALHGVVWTMRSLRSRRVRRVLDQCSRDVEINIKRRNIIFRFIIIKTSITIKLCHLDVIVSNRIHR